MEGLICHSENDREKEYMHRTTPQGNNYILDRGYETRLGDTGSGLAAVRLGDCAGGVADCAGGVADCAGGVAELWSGQGPLRIERVGSRPAAGVR